MTEPTQNDLELLRQARDIARTQVTELRRARRAARETGEAAEPQSGPELAEAEERLRQAELSLKVFSSTGSPHGLVVDGNNLVGTVGVQLDNKTRPDRQQLTFDAVHVTLQEHAERLGLILTAGPPRYGKFWSGTDDCAVFEVEAKIEGDYLVPTRIRGDGATKRREKKR